MFVSYIAYTVIIIFDLSAWALLIPHHFFMQDSLSEKILWDMTSYSPWLQSWLKPTWFYWSDVGDRTSQLFLSVVFTVQVIWKDENGFPKKEYFFP